MIKQWMRSREPSLLILSPILLALTLLALPLSSSAKSIFLSLAVLTILAQTNFRDTLFNILSAKWCIASIAIFAIAIIACLQSPASFADQKFVLAKYSKLLYLPILAYGFIEARTRQLAIHAFLLAMLITCILSTLAFYGYLSSWHINPDFVFRNHIMTGFMMAFAAYLSWLFAYRQAPYPRWLYLGLSLLFTYHVLCINGGRIGYVVYLLFLALLITQICNFRQAMLGFCIVASLFISSYFTSSIMHERLNTLVEHIHGYQHNEKDTPIGTRLQFQYFAYKLFLQHPFLGNGTASFTYYFKQKNPVPSWSRRLWEPHSQYWLIAAEFGLLGLVALFFFFGSLFKVSRQLQEMKPIGIAMLLGFMVGNLSDSLLFYSGSGYFFILFMAICLGEKLELHQNAILPAKEAEIICPT